MSIGGTAAAPLNDRPFWRDAAEAAWDLVNNRTPKSTTEVDGIPSFLNQPVSVNVDNIMDTIIKDEFYKVSEICTAEYAAACEAAGIK